MTKDEFEKKILEAEFLMVQSGTCSNADDKDNFVDAALNRIWDVMDELNLTSNSLRCKRSNMNRKASRYAACIKSKLYDSLSKEQKELWEEECIQHYKDGYWLR